MASLLGNFSLPSADKSAVTSGAGAAGLAYTHEAGDASEKKQTEDGGDAYHATAGPKTASSSSDEEDEKRAVQRRDENLLALARSFSSQVETSDPFNFENEDSHLNPKSPNFNPRAWAKALINLQNQSPDNYQQRTAGFAFKDLNVWGYGADTDYQKTVSNAPLMLVGLVKKLFGNKGRRIDILQDMDGVVDKGEMLVVLGPPGSGCSTFLKTISGEINGFYVDENSYINYQGISPKQMHKDFRGEAIYTAEVDVHFPQLTVGQTLSFAAHARSPRVIPGGLTRNKYADMLRDVYMAMFGISHTINTNVGNDFIRGVSGGERKRVTIAEAALSGAPLQCWDNSTRGLDSANAVEFCKTLRMNSDLSGTTSAVAIYQSPQVAYDVFDKVTVLYEGRQIFFGKTTDAKAYFVNMGFHCPHRQTVPDFLTSMTSPLERVVEEGFEHRVPRTSAEFARRWKESPERAALVREIDQYDRDHAIGGPSLAAFQESRRKQMAKRQRLASPYTLSYWGQVMLCLQRGFQRLKADPSLTFTQLFGNFLMALVVGSVFYNLQDNTDSFFRRSSVIFFALLLNAFGSALEILTLYAQRSIVEKHSRYAFYHPSAEAWASMLTDMPYKILNAIIFNLTVYFMVNLRREPGNFFFFVLISFMLTMAMSMLFRTIASVSRTLAQAMPPTAILILGIVIYTGFALPIPFMHGWARWINYLDLVGYGFESLMVNEFWGRDFTCSNFIPSYGSLALGQQVCSTVGSVPGQNFVNGGVFIQQSYEYTVAHKWRNFGLLWIFTFGLMITYIAATEFITEQKSKGEILLFRRGHTPPSLRKKAMDEESGSEKPVGAAPLRRDVSHIIDKQTAIFHWEDMCFDIKIKGEPRRILDNVDGWVKPGTLTALMGVSGAGKTTLLDVLATRVTIGVVTGDAFVDGRPRDTSFQRKTGYVQQQDLHLQTQTVREALIFSALLRQPSHVPKQEKIEYVSQVIELLDMTEYADAIVGVPGEGLNVEQRKRLTIGVELAAKPQLLLFLDEPTSGLDSQTSWAILDLLEKLKNNGQAILCTIHQPSAVLFQRFDRLLFLQKGGQTIYFGPIGEGSAILTEYFEKNGASPCPTEANPAEWMLEVIGAAPGSHSDIDWHQVWRKSGEYESVKKHLAELREELPQITKPAVDPSDKSSYREFAAHYWTQQWLVSKRVFEQYWRTPVYIYSKIALCVFSTLFIGFSFFNAGTSIQSIQNQLFSIFMLFIIFGQLVQQIMPHFVTQRALYEARERPSKTYSWQAFILSNVFVEIPWNALMSVAMFFCWYYPIGFYKNAEPTGEVHSRGFLVFLLVLQFMLFTSTFATMIISAIPTAETGGNIANLMFSLTLIFCGVLVAPGQFPQFWIFMYRVSPFTYLVSALLSTGLANTDIVCVANEFVTFNPPPNMTCQQYVTEYQNVAGGYLAFPDATTSCSYCPESTTNQVLAQVSANYSERWRNFGILWAFIIFNVFGAIFLYWIARVPKKSGKAKKE